MAWDIPNIIINLRKEIEESSGDVSDLETRVGTLESTVTPLPGRITAAEGKIDALQADLDATPVTVTGTTIEIENAANIPAESLTMEVVPTQDLNGYSKPWAGGTGKNKLRVTKSDDTMYGITTATSTDGVMTISGVCTGEPYTFVIGEAQTSEQSLLFSLGDGATKQVRVYFEVYYNNEKVGTTSDINVRNNVISLDLSSYTFDTVKVYTKISNGTDMTGNVWRPMLRLSTETDPTFEPYANVCPITGKSSVKIETTDGDTTNDAEVTLGATVYAGEIDFNAGTGTSTMANIASYDGETINEPWLSSMDEYTEGGTPTTGAQVVYTLDTPTTVSFTADKLTLLEGAQTVTGNGGGDITVAYQKDNLIGDLKKWVLANT